MSAHHFLDLVSTDRSTIIFIEHLKGLLQLIVIHQTLIVHRCHHELRVVDRPIPIDVDFLEDLIYLLFSDRYSKMVFITVQNLFLTQVTVSVNIESLKYLFQMVCFIFRNQLRCNESECSLSKFLFSTEVSEVL